MKKFILTSLLALYSIFTINAFADDTEVKHLVKSDWFDARGGDKEFFQNNVLPTLVNEDMKEVIGRFIEEGFYYNGKKYYLQATTSSAKKTTIYFSDGTSKSYDWGGEISRDSTMVNAGLFDGNNWTKEIVNVEIGSDVTSIGNNTFFNCTNLTSITIPSSIVSIRRAAFLNCFNIKNVYISDLAAWCAISFSDSTSNPCTYSHVLSLNGFKITELIIPDSITSIRNFAFNSCTNLTSIIIPDSITSIGHNAFTGCRNITSIIIPNSVTSIENEAFKGCHNLISIKLPPSITSINGGTFSSCINLASIEIPSSVENIEDYAFFNCKNIKTINIPDSVTNIGERAFGSCNFTSIIIPESVKSIGDSIFQECHNLTSVTILNSITNISSFAFQSCTSLTSIAIPNSVKSINAFAFEGCTSLTTLIIPTSVENIDSYAFQGCNNLLLKFKGKTIDEVKTMNNYPWGLRENQISIVEKTTIYFSDGTSTSYDWIGEINRTTMANASLWDGISWTKQIVRAEIGDSVTSIGDSTFQGCLNLTSITLPNSVTSIGNFTFGACYGLTSITIPNSVTSIGKRAFGGCKGLTSIIIPNSVKNIGDSVLCDCTNLTSVIIGNSVTSIETNAFGGCERLISVTIPNSVTNLETQAFYYCSNLASITIPNSVTIIGNSAFASCHGLTSITIPNSVTIIGKRAFGSCKGLTSIIIPNSVKNIGADAFRGCNNLLLNFEGKTIDEIKIMENYPWGLNENQITTEIDIRSCGFYFDSYPRIISRKTPYYMAFYYLDGIHGPITIDIDSKFAKYIDVTKLSNITTELDNIDLSYITNNIAFKNDIIAKHPLIRTDVYYHFYTNQVEILNLYHKKEINNYSSGVQYKLNQIINYESLSSTNRGIDHMQSLPVYDFDSILLTGGYPGAFGTFDRLRNIETGYINILPTDLHAGKIIFDLTKNPLENNTSTNHINGFFTGTLIFGGEIEFIGTGKPTYITFSMPSIIDETFYHGTYFDTFAQTTNFNISITNLNMYHFNFPNKFTDKITLIINKDFNIFFNNANESLTICNFTDDYLIPINIIKKVNNLNLINCSGGKFNFLERTKADVMSMKNYPFNASVGTKFICTDGTITVSDSSDEITRFYLNNGSVIETNIVGEITKNDIASFRTNLIEVAIGNLVTSISTETFSSCVYLTTVSIPDSVTVINDKAFMWCHKLTSISIPDSVTSIGDWTFGYCSNLRNITLPNSLTSIGNSAFNWCTNIFSITIPNSVKNIKSSTFNWCANLKSIVIPNSLTNIENSAFTHCASLESITIPASVENIGTSTFDGCSKIQSFIVDKNNPNYSSVNGLLLSKDGKNLIAGINNNNIIIPNSVINIENSAFHGYNLTSITIPNSVKNIKYYSFSNCEQLTSITIPNSVTNIGWGVFENCYNLQNITIPDSVTSIGKYAFRYCNNLSEVTFTGKTKTKIQSTDNYPWDIKTGSIIHCTDGDITIQ